VRGRLADVRHLLSHPDARKTPRVSAFFDFVNDEIETLRPILSG
jgi:hypothetical protein